MGVRVALLYNLADSEERGADDPPDGQAEFDSEQTILAIRESLVGAGHQVLMIEGTREGIAALWQEDIDIAFNICEGFKGRNREAHVPALLELLGIAYTGSDVLTLAVALDKPTTKRILTCEGIPTPRFQVFYAPTDVLTEDLRYPLFVKPAHEGSSMGISAQSKVNNETELRERVDWVTTLYRQPALVEEFIAGREFTVSILGNASPVVFPVMEISFERVPEGANGIYSHQYKKEWTDRGNFLCPAPLDPFTNRLLQETSLKAFRALGCRDFGRIDFRLSEDGVPYVIEVNPLPGLAPGYSDYPVSAEAAGWSYAELINAILTAAMERTQGQAVRLRA